MSGAAELLTGAPAAAPARTAQDHWREAWTSALSAVELDVDAAEELIHRLHRGEDAPDTPVTGEWVAPALLGPVPAEFADRARLLAQRQLDVSERLVAALTYTRAQRRVLQRLEQPAPPPVFIDTAL